MLSGIALAFMVLGFVAFSRRDLPTPG